MRLCVSAALILLLALTWTRAAPSLTPGSEECSKLNLLTDKTQVLGQLYFQAAFTDSDLFRRPLALNYSLWSYATETPTGLSLTQFIKTNGTCIQSRVNVTTDGRTGNVQRRNMKSEFQLLNLSNTSFIVDIKVSASNNASFIQSRKEEQRRHLSETQHQKPSDIDYSVIGHNFYLIAKRPMPSKADLQRFIAYANCAGFPGLPDFIQKNEQEYCSEEESVLMP